MLYWYELITTETNCKLAIFPTDDKCPQKVILEALLPVDLFNSAESYLHAYLCNNPLQKFSYN